MIESAARLALPFLFSSLVARAPGARSSLLGARSPSLRLCAFSRPTAPMELPARLLVSAAEGQPVAAASNTTIHDVPLTALAGGSELAMVVVNDAAAHRVLLGLPNSLGWRYHLGVRAPHGESATLGLATDSIKDLALRSLVDSRAPDLVREAGVMLFTFVTEPPAQHAPMRVRVFETRSSSAASSAECLEGLSPTIGWYGHDEIPFGQMWQDDELWLPRLLAESAHFEGHFVFEGGPGAGSRVLQHNCAFRCARDR